MKPEAREKAISRIDAGLNAIREQLIQAHDMRATGEMVIAVPFSYGSVREIRYRGTLVVTPWVRV